MKELQKPGDPAPSLLTDSTRPKVLSLDTALFQHRLDQSGMSEDEKSEYLQILWSIIVQFVDLGYGIHPLQQSCGQVCKTDFQRSIQIPEAVEWNEQPSTRTINKTVHDAAAEREDA